MRTPQIQKASLYTHVILAGEYKADKLLQGKKALTLEEIFLDVCEVFDENPKRVNSSNRKRNLVMCRSIFCYVARTLTTNTLLQIGEYLEKQDHTTVIHNIQKVKGFLEIKESLFMEYWEKYIDTSKIWSLYK